MIEIKYEDVSFIVIKGRGPGGQKVNKTSSAVYIKWKYLDFNGLSDFKKDLISKKLKNNINSENEVVIYCDESRSQIKNKKLALLKLNEKVQEALKVSKIRRKTTISKNQKNKNKEKSKKELILKNPE